VTAIKKDFEVLSSSSASQEAKLKSLKSLGHWVGDIHQPGKVKIGTVCVAANTPIVRGQLQKSGVRLAHLLDAALDK